MSTELPTFSNAFAAALDLPVLHLLGPCDDAVFTRRKVSRQLERWRTKALARALLDAWVVTTGYQLEKELVALEPSMAFPDQRPRLFDGMLSKGEPGIAKALAKPGSRAGRWVGKALSRAPNALDVLSDPVWRLLDPTPMPYIQWAMIGEALVPRVRAWMQQGSKPDIAIVRSPLTPDSDELLDYFVPRTEPTSLWGFLLVLVQLRRWEISGNLVAYFLQLLEAFERCKAPSVSAELAVLMPECAGFLAANFGRVHIGPTHSGNVDLQLQRINTARHAFEVVRGGLKSQAPVVVSN